MGEECRARKKCPTGECVLTKGYRLPAQFVIHAVGPKFKNLEKLRKVYKSALDMAKDGMLRSIAFSYIDEGFPKHMRVATHVALATVREWLQNNPGKMDRVIFVMHEYGQEEVYGRLIPYYFPRKG